MKVLFYFFEERKIGIVLIRVIVEKDVNIDEGKMVIVNWVGKKVLVEILVFNGKCSLNFFVFVILFYRIEYFKN